MVFQIYGAQCSLLCKVIQVSYLQHFSSDRTMHCGVEAGYASGDNYMVFQICGILEAFYLAKRKVKVVW